MSRRRFLPNALTCSNLICGCIATGAAFHANYQSAFLFILLGAVFDFFDGLAARLLKAPSPLGVELDSLADLITFGLTPSAMIFTLFTHVRYPELIYAPFWSRCLPFAAFLLAAFSAYRLAKFNLDERQHTGFIGLPTPACAIFWAALISSSYDYLCSPMFNAVFLLAFMLMFCFLLVSEIPMFSLKFHSTSLRERENIVRFGFLGVCTCILAVCAIASPSGRFVWQYLSRGLVACIGLYIIMGLVQVVTKKYKS